MLYPKVKRKRNKLKIFMNGIICDMKNFIIKSVRSITSIENFILLMRKCFHF